MINIVAIRILVDPFLDGVEHAAVDLDRLVPKGRVVEDAEEIVHHLIDWNSWVLPSIEDTPSIRSVMLI